MKKLFFLSSLLACTLMLSSCAQSALVEYPSYIDTSVTVTLEADELQMNIGETKTLDAFLSEASEGTTVKWLNEYESVVKMTYNGLTATLTALSEGTSYITAIAGASVASCQVVVGGSYTPITVTSLSLSESEKTLNVGENFNLSATVEATGGTPLINWVSGNEDVATISRQDSKNVIVTAKGKGSTAISAVCGSKTAQCIVTVDDPDETLSIRLNTSGLSIVEGKTSKLIATTKPSDAVVNWQSNDQAVATVDSNGLVTGVAVGKAVISATVTDGSENKTATCDVTVTSGSDSEYESKIAAWSKPGHLYMHYLRNSDKNYSKWALWIWPNYPHDGEGSLWAANSAFDLKGIVPQTYGFMTKAECGETGTDVYSDAYGQVIDVDLTLQTLPGGKTGKVSPLISDDLWTDQTKLNKAALGFLIVDQSKMTGKDMWVSDGGAETYIKRIGTLMPNGQSDYLHVYCVEGNVAEFTTSSGKQEFVNPTIEDKTGDYRSKNDISNLKYDAFTSGVATSTSFLEDRPGTGYQIFVPSFADSDGDGYGDIKGITNKLDYLEELGVDVLWLTPIQESNSYHGYDVTDYYKIDQRFGTLVDYQELIYKAHQKNMKVLMDMVINHTSKSNVLFKKSQRAETEIINGKTINYRDMYLWKYQGDKILEWNGVEGKYDVDNPATFITKNVEDSDDWYKDGTSNYYYYGKFGSGMAELNYSCQATRDYMTDMCKYWLSFGLDGFRLDAIKHIYLLGELDPTYNYGGDYISYDVGYREYWNEEMQQTVKVQNDYSYDRELNVAFWKQFAGTLKSAYPNCFLVGENFDGWNARIAPFYSAIDSQFDFSTYYHVHESTESGIVAMGGDINATLNYNKAYRADHINGAFTSNHDVARLLNHAASKVQTAHHVEVNNSNKVEANQRARWTAAITLLTPGVSWIYYGDEIGMSGNLADKVPDSTGTIVDDHGNNIDRWYRQPMRWSNTLGDKGVVKYGFSGLEVLWDLYNQNLPTVSEQQADPNSMFTLFKYLCHAKGDERYPTYGYIANQWAEGSDQNVLCLQISDGTRKVNAFINATGSAMSIAGQNQGELIYDSNGNHSGTGTSVPAYGFAVVVAK